MSDLIRSMMGMRRAPVGMGNNPSPFPIAYPSDVPQEPAMPEEEMRRMEGMNQNSLQQMMMDGASRDYGSQIKDLKSYYENERKPQQQRSMPPLGGSAWTMGY
jgi:hypothetical protein